MAQTNSPPTLPSAIGDVMSTQPHTIGRDQTLGVAHRMMREHGIRHLPVLVRGKVVGIVSQRDLYFLETIAGVDFNLDIVEDAMTPTAYTVGPRTSLEKVARKMAKDRLGSAVVVANGRVVGIFTATDALKLIARPSRVAPRKTKKKR